MVQGNTSTTVTKNIVVASDKNDDGSTKYAYSNNYKGKNPMTRTQWRRYQRYKKAIDESFLEFGDENVDPKGKQKVVEVAKRSVKERFHFPQSKKIMQKMTKRTQIS